MSKVKTYRLDPATFAAKREESMEYTVYKLDNFDYVQVIGIEAPDGFSVDCSMEKTPLPFKFKVYYKPIEGQFVRGDEHWVNVTVKATGPEKEQEVALKAKITLTDPRKLTPIDFEPMTVMSGVVKPLLYTLNLPEFEHIQVCKVIAPDFFRVNCTMEKNPFPFQFEIHYEPQHIRETQQHTINIEAVLIGKEGEKEEVVLICPIKEEVQEKLPIYFKQRTVTNGVSDGWTCKLDVASRFIDCTHIEILSVDASDVFIVDCKMAEKIELPATFMVDYTPKKAHDSGSYYLYIEAVLTTGNREQKVLICIPVDIEDAPEAKYQCLVCTVCLLPFSDIDGLHKPKIFPTCGHTLCAGCLAKITPRYEKINNVITNVYVSCPNCRKEFLLEDVPLDFSLLEAISAENRGDTFPVQAENVANPIVGCFENEFHESSIFCEECEQPYCRSCFDQVHSVRKNREHRGIPLMDRPAIIPNCDKHQNVEAKHICLEDNCSDKKLLCGLCKGNHKQHNMKKIEAVIEENKEKLDQLLDNIYDFEAQISALFDKSLRCLMTFHDFPPNDQIRTHEEKIEELKFSEMEFKLHVYRRSRSSIHEEMRSNRRLLYCNQDVLKAIRSEITREQTRKNNLHDVRTLIARAEIALQSKLPDHDVFFEVKHCVFDLDTKNIIYKPNTNTAEADRATSGAASS